MMPHTKTAKKRLRQNEKRRLHNRAIKKAIKIQTKTFLAALKPPLGVSITRTRGWLWPISPVRSFDPSLTRMIS